MVMMMFMMTFMSMAAMPMSSLASFLAPMMMTWVALSMFVVMVSSSGFRSAIYCHISYVHNIIFNRYHANRARLVIVLGSIEIILKMTYNVDIWLRSPVIIKIFIEKESLLTYHVRMRLIRVCLKFIGIVGREGGKLRRWWVKLIELIISSLPYGILMTNLIIKHHRTIIV